MASVTFTTNLYVGETEGGGGWVLRASQFSSQFANFTGLLIPTALVEGDASVFLRHFQLAAGTTSSNFRTDSVDFGSGVGVGPQMSAAWEVAELAITLASGGASVTIKGPGNADNSTVDTIEPYSWVPSVADRATLETFLSGLGEGTHSFTLTLSDEEPPTIRTSIRAGVDVSAPTVEARLSPPDTSEGPVMPPILNRVWERGVAVDEVLPMPHGGTGTLAVATVGDVPGVAFTGRAASGTPTATGNAVELTTTVTDGAGRSHAQKWLATVGAGAPSLFLPPPGDRTWFVGDMIDETIPAARGASAAATYDVDPLPAGVALVGRLLSGAPTVAGDSTHSVTVTDGGMTKTRGIRISVRRLDRDAVSPFAQGEHFLETRVALHIPRHGARQAFSFWSGDDELTLDGVTYQPAEVVALGSYSVATDSTDPLPVIVAGADPVFRAWLNRGGSVRPAECRQLLRVGSGAWEVVLPVLGRVGQILEDGPNHILHIDSDVYTPSQQKAESWSDDDHQSEWAGDLFWRGLKALARGFTRVWPG